jgi:hypothetical protein
MVSDRIYCNSVWLHDEVCFIKCDEGFSTKKENIFIPEKLKNFCSFKPDCNRNNSIDTKPSSPEEGFFVFQSIKPLHILIPLSLFPLLDMIS